MRPRGASDWPGVTQQHQDGRARPIQVSASNITPGHPMELFIPVNSISQMRILRPGDREQGSGDRLVQILNMPLNFPGSLLLMGPQFSSPPKGGGVSAKPMSSLPCSISVRTTGLSTTAQQTWPLLSLLVWTGVGVPRLSPFLSMAHTSLGPQS